MCTIESVCRKCGAKRAHNDSWLEIKVLSPVFCLSLHTCGTCRYTCNACSGPIVRNAHVVRHAQNTHNICVEMNRKQTFLALLLLRKNILQRKKRKHHFWVTDIFIRHGELGSIVCFGSCTMEIMNLSKAVFGCLRVNFITFYDW